MCSSLMATSWLLRIVLLLTTFDLADDKFYFAPVQSPDLRSSQRKKILVQGDEPQKLSVKFLFWGRRGIFGVKNEKNEDKNFLLLTLFLKLVKQFYKLQGYWR